MLKIINKIFKFILMGIDKISKWTGIRRDIVIHIILGLLIAGVALIWLTYTNKHLFWAAVAAAVAGALKELIWDMWWKKGYPDWLDFFGTAGAGAFITAIFYIV